MARSRTQAGTSVPSPEQKNPRASAPADPATDLADEELITAASRARRAGDEDAPLVSELLKRAATDNRAALDRLAR